jgi:hypothetical protein
MDPAKQLAISACGRCGQAEDLHKYRCGEDQETISVLAALGGPCAQFVASDAAVIYSKHLAIAGRDPRYRPGRVGKRGALCPRCGQRGHKRENCPF